MTFDEMVAALPGLRDRVEAALRATGIYSDEINTTCHHCRNNRFGAADANDLPIPDEYLDEYVAGAVRVIEQKAREDGVFAADLKVRAEIKGVDGRRALLVVDCLPGPHLN